MPGTLIKTTPTTVMPQTLCTAFVATHSRWGARENTYPDASSQRDYYYGLTEGRRAWQMEKAIPYSDFATLQSFWEACNGSYQPFYFYDPYDVEDFEEPGSNYDPTGVAIAGRYVCRFEGGFRWAMQRPGLIDVQVAIMEAAE